MRRLDAAARRRVGALSRRRLGMAWLPALALTVTVLAAGCVTVPTSGHVQAVNVTQGGSSQGHGYLQPIPAPPGRDWTPRQIVSGFLAANASFAGDHAVAREYLTHAASRTWQPGWAVTVLAKNPAVQQLSSEPGVARSPRGTTIVEVTGQEQGHLSGRGQYAISPVPQGRAQERFSLARVGGEWRISALPSSLLLTQADFQRVYQSRYLYFFDPPRRVLVPDPVYVPQEDTPTDLMTRLVQALMSPPAGWLAGAARTAFPAGTRLLNGGAVALDGGTAIVNLGGTAASASETALQQMSAQLLWTLGGSSSDQPAVQSVELEINGAPRTLPGSGTPVQEIGPYSTKVPAARGHGSFYYTDSRGAVRSLSGRAQANAPQGALVRGQAGTGQIPLTQIAVSPDGRYVAGLTGTGPGGTGTDGAAAGTGPGDAAGGRTAVYTGALSQHAGLTRRTSGQFTSLSWDNHDDLWVADGGGIRLLPATGGPAIDVGDSLPPGSRVLALKVAPDGVRCAMIVATRAGTRLMLAAVSRTGKQSAYIGKPVPISGQNVHFTALTWYDADHVIVLSQAAGGPMVDEVAVNGEMLSPFPAERGTVSITADGPSDPLVAGLSDGQMVTLASLGGLWSGVVGPGRDPVYPG